MLSIHNDAHFIILDDCVLYISKMSISCLHRFYLLTIVSCYLVKQNCPDDVCLCIIRMILWRQNMAVLELNHSPLVSDVICSLSYCLDIASGQLLIRPLQRITTSPTTHRGQNNITDILLLLHLP